MYSAQWAIEVVKTHYRAHPRVSYYILCRAHFTRDHLARWLASRDPRWELYKKVVSFLETFLIGEDEITNYSTDVNLNMFSALDAILGNLHETAMGAVFTALGMQDTLEKHSLKARASAKRRNAERIVSEGQPFLNL